MIMTIAEPSVRRFTRREYYKMAEAEVFGGQRVELLGGKVINMSPQNESHAVAIMLIDALLHREVPKGHSIRCQLPLVVNDLSEPEPDFAVVAGEPIMQRGHPETALLVIEISESSLRHDRDKAAVYASADVPEYWIVNLIDRQLEVHKNPIAKRTGRFAKRYEVREIVGIDEEIQPQSLPIKPLAVAGLFPSY
jgi:Uma2 family endonuclease